MNHSRKSKKESVLSLDTIAEIERRWCVSSDKTHHGLCYNDHPGCAVKLLIAEIDRLRDAVQSLLGLSED